MKEIIKKIIPQPIKVLLRPLKKKLVDDPKKRSLFLQMQKKHQQLIKEKKDKKKLKVVFLAIHKSVWKVDPVFKKMLEDPYFEPLILVCPYTPYGDERMWEDMKNTYEYFENKGYPLLSSYNKDEKSWIQLNEINPDIVFFTNPHNLTRKEYYEDAYMNYLSCYVPYHHEVVTNEEQFNQNFHIAQWKIFASHKASLDIYKNISVTKAQNVLVTGYPSMEIFLEKLNNNSFENPWKNKDDRLRIIWAPHHSVELNQNVPYSNFLNHSNLFVELAEKYKNKIIICFKPHPMLKVKLYNHPNWGKEKTDNYYSYWKSNEFTQINEGEYIDLFCSSDAMIHDSGSFLAEYLYMKKPVLFNLSPINEGQHYSDFGLQALKACSISKNNEDIISFIENIITRKEISKEHEIFLEKNILKYFMNIRPSDMILKEIKKTF
ncbi:hypothetical protein HOK00_05815 [bacterium]|jgi:CDP-glycerol glycerophosphotransferase (TagB/SpsB family)|nr:hypothetical protein [bacterium]